MGFEIDNYEDFKNKLYEIVIDYEKINVMKRHCLKKANQYKENCLKNVEKFFGER